MVCFRRFRIGAANKAVIYQWESRKRTLSPVFWQRVLAIGTHRKTGDNDFISVAGAGDRVERQLPTPEQIAAAKQEAQALIAQAATAHAEFPTTWRQFFAAVETAVVAARQSLWQHLHFSGRGRTVQHQLRGRLLPGTRQSAHAFSSRGDQPGGSLPLC
jgi:hypothetical protein